LSKNIEVNTLIVKQNYLFNIQNNTGELLPLLEAGVSWEVSAFASQIYLSSSSDSSYPVFLFS
jgi:hypothetical protein